MLRLWICLFCLAAVSTVKLDKRFNKQVVAQHNKYRKHHQVNLVVESKKMSRLAQKWAERIQKKGYTGPKPNNKYGETYNKKQGKVKGSVHVADMYMKVGYYLANQLFGKEPPNSTLSIYGPFTQLAWKATKKIGVGRAGGNAVVFYWPKGNIVNKFAENVFPPKK